jgi:hypothetical protein
MRISKQRSSDYYYNFRSLFSPVYHLQDLKQFEFNALNQITWWGPDAEILDYAFKQWSGVIGRYALPRWQAFVQYLVSRLASGLPYRQKDFDGISAKAERTFFETGLLSSPQGLTLCSLPRR